MIGPGELLAIASLVFGSLAMIAVLEWDKRRQEPEKHEESETQLS
jgi:hypothetical protein